MQTPHCVPASRSLRMAGMGVVAGASLKGKALIVWVRPRSKDSRASSPGLFHPPSHPATLHPATTPTPVGVATHPPQVPVHLTGQPRPHRQAHPPGGGGRRRRRQAGTAVGAGQVPYISPAGHATGPWPRQANRACSRSGVPYGFPTPIAVDFLSFFQSRLQQRVWSLATPWPPPGQPLCWCAGAARPSDFVCMTDRTCVTGVQMSGEGWRRIRSNAAETLTATEYLPVEGTKVLHTEGTKVLHLHYHRRACTTYMLAGV